MEDTINVSDLIFKELIKRGYSIEGGKHIWNIADSKLWYYTPEQAQAFLDLESSEDYQKDVIQKEINLINSSMSEILEKVGADAVNIIDLGCGDGKKAILFIEQLKGKVQFRYCPIDISSYMVEKAMAKVNSLNAGEVVECKWNISDFENIENVSTLLRQGNFNKNLILLLGNTLGNFEINELLYRIRASMKDYDILVIGNGLDTRKPEDILKAYDTADLNKFLAHIPTKLGLAKEDVEYKTRFKNSRVEMYYSIKNEKKISFQDKEILFRKGDEIIVAISYKYNLDDFKTFLHLYFGDVTFDTSEDKSYVLALCKK